MFNLHLICIPIETIGTRKLVVESTRITISLGVTELQNNDTYETLFKRVDNALYQSKRNGKNRISIIMDT